jgi:proteasome lid subunit RPN8/RPN11
MVNQARAEFPLECCGLLAGQNGRVTQLYKMINSDQSRVTYLMEPREQFKVFKDIRQKGLQLLSIYHSHPKHPAYPSGTDVKLAYYPEAVYLILSIASHDGDTPLTKGFHIVQGQIEEVAFTVE